MRYVALLLVLSFVIVGCGPVPGDDDSSTLFIGAWNLQRLGDAKASDAALLERYAAVVRDFDIFVVQEVTDKDGSAFQSLCATVGEDYSCLLSSRAGTTSYKEQYGVFVRYGIGVFSIVDYNALNVTGFERAPYSVTLNASGYVVTLYTIHTKPEAARAEIDELERLIDSDSGDAENVIVLGDLNADCSYYSRGDDFSSWKWAISQDTTFGRSDCAYDRILLNADARREYRSAGVSRVGGEGVSDHNAVWVALHRREKRGWLS